MQDLIAGFAQALSPDSLAAVLGGVFIGYIVGVLPGLNRGTALAVTIPLTFYLSPVAAIGLLIGISKGSASGGAVTAIMINTPGEPASAATCLDGYPMARAGRARSALTIALVASVAGDMIATLVLILVAAPFAAVALRIGPMELTAIILFALTFIAGLSGGSLLKGLLSAALGMLVGCVGIDVESGETRLTFGFVELYDGVALSTVAIGMLALTEMLSQLAERSTPGHARQQVAIGADRVSAAEWRLVTPAILRGSAIGIAVGALPGIGASIASFLSYAATQRASKTPERFGHGAPEGVAAAESADNAVVPASLIPLFALGIPGSVAAALLIGAFMVHGVTPGPLMFTQHASLVYGVYGAMLLASLAMLPIGFVGLRFFARIALLPREATIPVIVFLCVAGAWLEGSGGFGVALMLVFGAVGLVFRILGLNVVTFLVGFILAPMFELALRQSLLIAGWDPRALLSHPIALAFLALTLISAWRLSRRTVPAQAG